MRYSLILSFLFGSCQFSNIEKGTGTFEYVYRVLNCDNNSQIIIDGIMDPGWEKAILLNNFKDHWNHKEVGLTRFRALWDNEWLYFIYEVEDTEIILEQGYSDSESNAVRSDRIELFFSDLVRDSIYYAFEIDADARRFDSKGVFKKYIDREWDMPSKDIQLASSKHKSGYVVEGKLSIQKLKELSVITKELELKTGLFRGEYSSGQDSIIWISWGKSNSPKPNFHLPSAFKTLKLDNPN